MKKTDTRAALISSFSPNGVTLTYWALRSRDGRNWNWSQLGSDPGDLASEVIAPNLWARVVGPVYFAERIPQRSIETSTDDVSWTTRYVAPGLSDVALVNGRLVAISLYGSLLESDPLLSLSQSAAGVLSVRRAAGIPVVVESSADLSQWRTVTNFPSGEPIQNFIDPEARNSPVRFYRARTP